MNIAFRIFKFPILILVANVILDRAGTYVAVPWIDMPMHFLGGASIGLAGVGFLALLRKQELMKTLPLALYAFFVMSFVGFAAVSWELWEFSLDRVFSGNAQADLLDTMVDMFFGLLGGLATLMLWLVLRKRRQ